MDNWKYRKIMDGFLGEPKKSEDFQLRNAANQVIDLARVHLLGYRETSVEGDIIQLLPVDLEAIQRNHDLESNVTDSQLLEVCNKALAIGSAIDCQQIDFTDMIWLPVFHRMKATKIGGLIVDECQDLNRAQQELVMMQGHQIICVGDVNQAIYGFAGADSVSMERLEKTLGENGGVDVMPLTMTRRCGRKVVELAQNLVPTYKAADTNPEGLVRDAKTDAVLDELEQTAKKAEKTTMALCRTNAPLVSLAFRLLRREVPVFIRGKDIGDGLIKLVEKVAGKSNSLDTMIAGLEDYASKEEAKIRKRFKYGAEDKVVALEDKVDCIRVLASDCENVTDLTNKLARLFQDKDSGKTMVLLSSVHKAKGLEADNVYIYRPELLPHPKLLEKKNGQQEFNLQYVAYTRAIHELVFMTA
jgi:superfamily I DNA/RNA helicase